MDQAPADRTSGIYLLVNLRPPGDFDELRACVVVASSEEQARLLAARNHGTENGPQWTNPAWSRCQRIGTASPGYAGAALVLDRFRHGHGRGADDPDRDCGYAGR